MKICFVAAEKDLPEALVLQNQIERERMGSLSFFILPAPVDRGWQPPGADLYLLPIRSVLELAPEHPVPLFAYGPPLRMAEAFEAGCADYIGEPIQKAELEARLLRILTLRLRIGGRLAVCTQDRRLHADPGDSGLPEIMLNEAEFRLFRILALNLNSLVPRPVLEGGIWGGNPPKSRTLDVHLAHLRAKLGCLIPGAEKALRGIRGEGYILLGAFCG